MAIGFGAGMLAGVLFSLAFLSWYAGISSLSILSSHRKDYWDEINKLNE